MHLGCGYRAKFSPSIWGGGGYIGNRVGHKGDIHPFSGGRRDKQIEHTSYCIHQIPCDTLNCVLPSNTLLPRTLIFPNFPASKTWPEEQIFWGTDPLGAPDPIPPKSRMKPHQGHNAPFQSQAAQTHVAREGCNVIYITYVTRAGVALQTTVENIRDFVWEIYH